MLESKALPAWITHVFCPGEAEFYGRVFHDWDKKGHGDVDVHKAIVHSCDVFFYNVGKQLGMRSYFVLCGQSWTGTQNGS